MPEGTELMSLLSFWAEIDGNRIVPVIGEEDAWILNIYLDASDADELTFVYENGTLSVSIDRMYFNQGGALSIANPRETCTIELGTITGDSTVSILDDTIYIDCEIGEVYSIREGELVPLNSTVNLGSDLPKLEPGENEITFSDTIEGLKITPRWWQI